MKKVFLLIGFIAILGCSAFLALNAKTKSDDSASTSEQANTEQAEAKTEDQDQTEQADDKKKEIVYTVALATAEAKEMSSFVGSSATLRAQRKVDVFSKVAGQITAMHVEEGKLVAKGDVLVELDGGDARLELEKAKVNLAKAQADFQRIEASYRKKLVATEEFDAKKFQLEDLKAAFDLASYKVSLNQVVAPFDATVTRRFIELGQTVQPSEQLFEIATLNPLEADVFLPENKVATLNKGQAVSFSVEENFQNSFKGTVSRISPVVDSNTGTVKVTVSITDAPENIRPGTYATLRITTNVVHEDVVLPKKAIVFDNFQKASVFIVENSEEAGIYKVKKVIVETGMEDGTFVAIKEGLETGSQVVLTGKEALKDGALVKQAGVTVSMQ